MKLGVLYISTSIWVLRTPKAGQNMLFTCFLCKKAEKGRKSKKIDAKFDKKMVYLSLHQNTGRGFYYQKKCVGRFILLNIKAMV